MGELTTFPVSYKVEGQRIAIIGGGEEALNKARLVIKTTASVVIISRAVEADFSELPVGQSGLVQLLSLLPSSYPGHSILSEDVGTVLGEDDCGCGRPGKYFALHGRVQSAEVRGCSDAYAAG